MKSRNMIMVLSVLFLFMTATGYALEWESTCINTTHLFKEANLLYNDTTYSFNQTVNCPSGCSDNLQSCNPSAFESNFLFIIIMAIILAMMFASTKVPYALGLPILFIDMVFTLYFMLMTDYFTQYILIIMSALVVAEVIFAFYIMKSRNENEDEE